MLYYYIILFFIFGLIVGSFLSVVISRLETGESIFIGRSKCPGCKKKIKSYDLVPLLSFMVLKGRCRHCEKKISLFYPLVELATGALFALLYWRFADVFAGLNLYLFLGLHLLILAALIVVFFYDWFYYIIPDKVLIPVGLVVLVVAVINVLFAKQSGLDFFIYSPNILNLVLGLIIGGGFFLFLVLISREKWMGWGDVKLGAFLGLFLGYPSILVALFFAFILGSIASVVLVLLKKKKMKDIIPFGPFLVLGGLIALFAGRFIVNWYLGI
ncbi:MAG: prepilin peptidase [Candidatus Magasanikbacteria bacterium]|nr:prepilin peptidase [Candidatus Magasanikbacteria bacterium]